MRKLSVDTGDVTTHGKDVMNIGEVLATGTQQGRAIEIAIPGLATAAAFTNYLNAWLDEGQRLSTHLDESGVNVVKADVDHMANEEALSDGYNAIRP